MAPQRKKVAKLPQNNVFRNRLKLAPILPPSPLFAFCKNGQRPTHLNFIYHFCSFSYSSLLQKCIFVFVYIDWISRQKTKRITKLLHKCFKRVSLYIIYRAVRATDHLGFFFYFSFWKKKFCKCTKTWGYTEQRAAESEEVVKKLTKTNKFFNLYGPFINDVTHLGGWGIYQKVALLHKPI